MGPALELAIDLLTFFLNQLQRAAPLLDFVTGGLDRALGRLSEFTGIDLTVDGTGATGGALGALEATVPGDIAGPTALTFAEDAPLVFAPDVLDQVAATSFVFAPTTNGGADSFAGPETRETNITIQGNTTNVTSTMTPEEVQALVRAEDEGRQRMAQSVLSGAEV